MRLRHVAPVGLSALALVFGAVPAIADSWSSHMTNWDQGTESRDWNDGNAGREVTKVKLKKCHWGGGADHLKAQPTLGLYRNLRFRPDDHRGNRFFQCFAGAIKKKKRADTDRWRVPSGNDYHFTLKKINGAENGAPGMSVTVKKVRVRY